MTKEHNLSDRLSTVEAQHGVAHALASIYLGNSFESIERDSGGWCEVRSSSTNGDPETTARIALAGPCADLAKELRDGEDVDPDQRGREIYGDETYEDYQVTMMLRAVDNWMYDALDAEEDEANDVVRTDGWVERVAPWTYAFVAVNYDLVVEGSRMLMEADDVLAYEPFVDRFKDRIVTVTPADLVDPARLLKWAPLDSVDKAIAEHNEY
ncbi:hypothetical protein [Cryobacterium sp. PH31-O1]|uniref:hypothetical protein n=1 Tax=Cryobacterium sp. PH31-O1 TaxID=3046306 RepID=UPI0024BB2EC5|nr:hypothetical protein [Cryobacterium sp. PH31-O1]MDJ0338705.1 hypothetical protein [Cryobacterium sp. PH31-O1]